MKISEKIWYVKSANIESKDLAYVTYYEENAAFEKRKETGTSWAGRYYRGKQEAPLDNEAVICDNELLSGYKILTNKSRYSTSNVVWRILDPRGFIFEIYSGNMCNLLLESVINNGTIEDECILGFDNGKVALLSKNSEPYQKALVETKIVKEYTGVFNIDNICSDTDDNLYKYLGAGYLVKKKFSDDDINGKISFVTAKTKYHIFELIEIKNKDTLPYNWNIGTIAVASKPKLSIVDDTSTEQNYFEYINDNILKLEGFGNTDVWYTCGISTNSNPDIELAIDYSTTLYPTISEQRKFLAVDIDYHGNITYNLKSPTYYNIQIKGNVRINKQDIILYNYYKVHYNRRSYNYTTNPISASLDCNMQPITISINGGKPSYILHQ